MVPQSILSSLDVGTTGTASELRTAQSTGVNGNSKARGLRANRGSDFGAKFKELIRKMTVY